MKKTDELFESIELELFDKGLIDFFEPIKRNCKIDKMINGDPVTEKWLECHNCHEEHDFGEDKYHYYTKKNEIVCKECAEYLDPTLVIV